ncbi:MotA/TolQ/ExbB proton channel family protein [Desulfuromonas sp.]|uniref:MotA/TolQ/ExbB proton channel family protein n=1 Tax=Desulfuromonas sp. TaxID=892 RepID=UPI0025C0EEF3|nr:MotA/TolQ/ExbB proton channel family protein [Desulfuromonas sp.]
MFSFFQDGGLFMYVILTVSIISLALFCERASFLFFRLKLNTDKAYQKILLALESLNYSAALEECAKIEKHPLGRILKAGLLKSDKRDKDIELAMEEKIMGEIPLVKARINYLTMFANISTLLGLLGTIIGLITAFQGVSSASEAAKQEILAAGISVAMLTTAFGLIVAIPCLVGFYVLNNRGDHLIEKFEEKALGLLNTLSALKREKDLECQG